MAPSLRPYERVPATVWTPPRRQLPLLTQLRRAAHASTTLIDPPMSRAAELSMRRAVVVSPDSESSLCCGNAETEVNNGAGLEQHRACKSEAVAGSIAWRTARLAATHPLPRSCEPPWRGETTLRPFCLSRFENSDEAHWNAVRRDGATMETGSRQTHKGLDTEADVQRCRCFFVGVLSYPGTSQR